MLLQAMTTLPIELVQQILHDIVLITLDDAPQLAVRLQLVSSSIQRVILPPIYESFFIDFGAVSSITHRSRACEFLVYVATTVSAAPRAHLRHLVIRGLSEGNIKYFPPIKAVPPLVLQTITFNHVAVLADLGDSITAPTLWHTHCYNSASTDFWLRHGVRNPWPRYFNGGRPAAIILSNINEKQIVTNFASATTQMSEEQRTTDSYQIHLILDRHKSISTDKGRVYRLLDAIRRFLQQNQSLRIIIELEDSHQPGGNFLDVEQEWAQSRNIPVGCGGRATVRRMAARPQGQSRMWCGRWVQALVASG